MCSARRPMLFNVCVKFHENSGFKVMERTRTLLTDTHREKTKTLYPHGILRWLVGCFGFIGPLRQYFSLYRAVSQREGERKEKKIDERKNVQTNPHQHLLQAQQALALL